MLKLAAYATKHARYPPAPQPGLSATSPNNLSPSPQHAHVQSSTSPDGNAAERSYARTPSPTPSEDELIRRKGAGFSIDKGNFKKYFTREYILRWVVVIVIIAFVVLIAVYMQKIVHALEPTCEKVKQLPGGFLIPIAILVVLSFPPLFGAEIVHVLCGVTWGVGAGFAIVAAGTLLGEVANFYTFRLCCRARAVKYERTNVKYGVLATVIRDGGFFFVVMCRLSSLPAHFTTVVFTLSGVRISIFAAAVVVSLVKVLPNIFGGALAREIADGEENQTTKTINFVVIGVTIAVTIVAMRYIDYKVDAAKPAYVYARRKSRQQQTVHAVKGEGFRIAAPRGQNMHASPAMWAEDYSQESLYTDYGKQAGSSQSSMLHNPFGDGRGTV